jgi:predicted lactoylglutathione lyase
MSNEVENTIPVLPVKSLRDSKAFYTDKLGFNVDWGDSDADTICQVSRDGHRIMLSEQTDIGTPSWVWIGLESDRLFWEFKNRGVSVLQEPTNRPWAYEMKVRDLDGNILWLGTEPRAGSEYDDAAED